MRHSTSKSSSSAPSTQSPPSLPRFALDENFPLPILGEILSAWTPEIDLVRLRTIDDRLTGGLEDHRLILALHQLGVEGLVTNDDNMLSLPEVLAIIRQTGFSVVTCMRAGHDPLVATGLLLVHLGAVAKRHRRGTPQVWRLASAEKRPDDFKALTERVQDRTALRIGDYDLSVAELDRPVL